MNLLGLVAVGVLWGGTNPLMNRGGEGISKRKGGGGVLGDLLYLFSRWRYVLPFALNQCGSLVYYYTLGEAEMSVAVPLANSFTFVFTAIASRLLGEEALHWHSCVGIGFVLFGVALMVQ
jgi:drug/metabolite transporter (DMT)-like permease